MKASLRMNHPLIFRALKAVRLVGLDVSASLRSPKSIFTEIYKSNYWGDSSSKSGTGSNLEQTRVIRAELPQVIKRLRIESMLDAPCGDYSWLSEVELGATKYIGMDIVSDLIRSNRQKYQAEGRTFVEGNVLADALPKVGLIFCRDLLVHYSVRNINKAIGNFIESGSTYLLTTSFPDLDNNVDIRIGDWRPINLQLPPFNLPAPLETIHEGCTEQSGEYASKSLCLWKLVDLARGRLSEENPS